MNSTDPDNPLTRLLLWRAAELDLAPVDVHRGFSERGVQIAPSTIRMWFIGGSVHDRHRLTLAEVLELPIGLLQLAAALREMERAGMWVPGPGNAEGHPAPVSAVA